MTDHEPRDPDDIPEAELPPPADDGDGDDVEAVDAVDDDVEAVHEASPPPASPPTDTGDGSPPGRRVAALVGAAALALAAFFGGWALGDDGDDGPSRGHRHESGWHDEGHRPPMPPERGVERDEDR